MIGLIIFSVICFIIIWFIIFNVTLKVQKRNLFKNIPEKLEKQDKRFFNNGEEVNFKELLGKEAIKKEVVEEVKEESVEIIEDIHPKEEEIRDITGHSETEKEQIETVKPTVKKTIKKLPTFKGDKFKLPELEG